MNNQQTALIAKKYHKQSLWVVAATTLIALFAVNIASHLELVVAIVVSAIFSVVVNAAFGQAWKALAKISPNNLTKLYLAAPAMRIILAAIVVVLYSVVVGDKQAIKGFAIVFAAFYLSMLVFDTLFFAKIEGKTLRG